MVRRGELGFLNSALPAIRAYQAGDVDGAKRIAARVLRRRWASKDPMARLCARAVLAADEDEAGVDAQLLAAMRSDIEEAFPSRSLGSTSSESRLGARLFEAELYEGALLVFDDLIPRQEASRGFRSEQAREEAVQSSRRSLATCHGFVGNHKEAVKVLRVLCQHYGRTLDPSDARSIEARGDDLGSELAELERYREAREVLEDAYTLALGQPQMARQRGTIAARLGMVRFWMGDRRGASAMLSAAIPDLDEAFGPGSAAADVCYEWLQRAQPDPS